MSKLKNFLKTSYEALNNWKKFNEIHIVLGNESCDLDSTISAISYGYFLGELLKNKGDQIAVFPVLNVSRDDFKLRTEHCSLLKDANIDLNILIYRSEIRFENFAGKCVKTYLVDHHVLAKNDSFLRDSVCKILDHRPVDKQVEWPSNVGIRIELVGSCATLVSDEISKNNEEILFEELAYLLYCTIIFDTLAALPENKKAKPLDVEIVTKLEEKYGFNRRKTRIELFKEIVELHADISNLTPEQLLRRDLKFIGNIPIPALPVLAEKFIEIPDALKSLDEICTKNNSNFVVLIGIEAKPNVKRDVGLFFKNPENVQEFRKNLIRTLKQSTDFEEIEKNGVVILRQSNIEYTRKQILPIVQKFYDEAGLTST